MIETLARILPQEGHYCLVSIKKPLPIKHGFYNTLEELEKDAENRLSNGWDVYYGCSTFKDGSSRKAPNALLVKSFWLDLDCGESDKKPFDSQKEALIALKKFCNTTGLPDPTLINSGNGVHVYWILQEAITPDVWQPVADSLKKLCRDNAFEADPVVTADVSRILRIPDTLNYKTDPPKEVKVWAAQKESTYTTLEEFAAIVGVVEVEVKPEPFVLTPLAQSIRANKQSRFETIIRKSVDGNGCAQIDNALVNQESMEEPLWRAVISIAANCIDADTAIHLVSNKHSGYTPAETTEKASKLADKPYRCATFESIAPEHCTDCPNKGKIGSPIRLGEEIKREEVLVEDIEATEDEKVVDVFDKPILPDPYFYAVPKGIYKKTSDDEPDLLIYENNFFLTKRLHDKEKGDLVFARLELPKDAPREFMIPLSIMSSKEELRKLLSQNGVLLIGKELDQMMFYLITCAKNQQHQFEAEIMRRQFGWADDDTKFILGDKEIGASTIKFSPPSPVTERLCPYFEPKGSLEEWKRVIAVYDMPDFEPHAFGFFTAFGAPLIKHLGYNGAMINLINSHSGTGKSTVLKMCNSVYGHPDKLLAQETDTFAHKMNRLGIMNNLPYTIDEITNMAPESVSTLLYGVSQGTGPGRMQSQNNMERKNDTTWALIALASSNSSMAEKLNLIKQFADGEIMRLLEYRIDATTNLSKAKASKLFEGTLLNNYGLAGGVYLQWVIQNLPKAVEIAKQYQEKLDVQAKLNARERFWSAVISCNIAGAHIAKSLNLIDLDVARVLKWATYELVPTLRDQISEPDIDFEGVLGAFVNATYGKILVVNGNVDARTSLYEQPILEPRQELLIRIEPDTKLMYIFSKALRTYCAKEQIIFKDLINNLKASGVFKKTERKRLGKGSAINAQGVDSHVFQYNEDMIDVADFVKGVAND
tara:strand:- start:157 stop:2958 length:2802 start_codon:yes stop_codon:yes gene_type:complete